MAVEINKLINERRIGVDDGCDYGAVILDNLNAAARARTRACYQPPVRAPFVSRPQGDDSPVVKIGNRNVYGRKVITGIYQLHLSGRTPVQIARLLKMPLHRVEHLPEGEPASAAKFSGMCQPSRCRQRLKLCAAWRLSRRREVSMSELILTEEFLLRRPPISWMDYWGSTSICALTLNRWRA